MIDEVGFIKESRFAEIPTKAYEDSAGFDLYCVHPTVIHPGATVKIDTKIGVVLPPGTYGRIAGRSGVSLRGGVIDRNYYGTIGVIMYNSSKTMFRIDHKDRIGQLIVEKIVEGKGIVVERIGAPGTSDDSSERGCRGFGSSGI
ncbi:Deoxyuridine 5'-triphosphate nucleotidohydrolase [Orchesella cincta]|uniref:Deoxyuridine 5'-triphosphate nucleotidohydrolase n=1 Tax=Orchesella cincta TaxID=48709 RepID=A0A1D2M919_ORCCI|nr:Deoxyuridine 5'-triphosphate nucleotidohydrolase [Orchesella cincta]